VSAAQLLAFDTSTECMALAVHGPAGTRLAVEPGGARASAALLPALQRLLGEAGLALRQVEAIAFGQGPGAFTGLRTSCAVAQGLGFGLGCRLLPVDSLLIVAEDARLQVAAQAAVSEVVVAMDARMDEAYAGHYRWAQGRWHTLTAPALYTLPALAEWLSSVPPAACLAGSALAAFGDRLGRPPALHTVRSEASRAAALMRLAQAMHRDGAGVDPADALPLYLRDKVALTTREREAVKAAAQAAPAAPDAAKEGAR
jgi:tRNA threonylcarbamoyladenosine biosynthesis protein TsaB